MRAEEHDNPISYSCHFSLYRDGEQFSSQTVIGRVISGKMELNDGNRCVVFGAGDMYVAHRHQLMKFSKYPDGKEPYNAIVIRFDELMLNAFAEEYHYTSQTPYEPKAFVKLKVTDALAAFFNGLYAQRELLGGNVQWQRLKQKEALLLLLQSSEELQHILFDFSYPKRINLQEFMEQNYQFNVRLDRFAFLSGRSLSTFKRDFERIYHETPSRWLLKRRLEAAHRMLQAQGATAMEVYPQVGFENLSHFSRVFKQHFGINASEVLKE